MPKVQAMGEDRAREKLEGRGVQWKGRSQILILILAGGSEEDAPGRGHAQERIGIGTELGLN